MNVVICHTDFRIYWPARILSLKSFLATKGISLHVIEIAGSGSPYAFAGKNSIDVKDWHILFPSDKIEDLNTNLIKKYLFRELDLLKPEIIIAGAIAFPSGALSTAWCKINKKKIIIFDDAKITDLARSSFVNYVKQQVYNCVDAVLYPSKYWDETGYFWQFTKEQIFYGVNVVDNHFWSQKEESALENDRKNPPYILSIGRLIPKKNFLFLIDAYLSVKDNYEGVIPELWIIGEGEEQEILEQYIKSNKISDIRIFPFMSQSDLKQVYRHADGFILASKSDETWGLVINEAMACGLPVIVSNKCGAAQTLVRDGDNGFLFDPFNKGSLVKVLMSFLSLSSESKAQMGHRSMDIIANWDLNRFIRGCYDAICYVKKQQYKKASWISNLVLYFWKGRYKPV